MKITGFDRVVIMVRDVEKALTFFRDKLNMHFLELEKEISVRDGLRSYVSLENHLHLLEPIFPLLENAAPPMRERVALLEKQEAFILALVFKTADIAETEADLKQMNIGIQHRYEASHDYVSIGMDNFAELVVDTDATLGILMAFASHE
jgi:catechol 2,3-dioxygenase-like lactoylglutathione lyase family enzyme